jgi:hypothetical protein
VGWQLLPRSTRIGRHRRQLVKVVIMAEDEDTNNDYMHDKLS